MYSTLIPPTLGRAISSAHAFTSNRCAGADKQANERGIRRAGPGAIAIVAALLYWVPGTTFAEYHGGHRGGSSDELSALTCGSGSLTGAATDACTVTLTQAAGSGGFAVTLKSSDSAVKVPASVTVASGAASASFTATASAVTTAQTATLTASSGRNSETYAVQLKPTTTTTPTGTAGLTVGSATVAFGSVSLNTPSTQTVSLTSSGTATLTISNVSIQGTGFTLSGITSPVTLAPGQVAALDVEFDPTAAGAATGTVTISSNAASGASAAISLSGTGTSTAAYKVELTWDAPASSSDAVAGYYIYRAARGSTSYQKLNSSVNQPTTYTDTTVQAGASYTYEVMSVDASGAQSAPSNVYAAAVP